MNDLEKRLAVLDCGETGGWLSDDLECGVDGEPWCLSHQLRASETARREAERQIERFKPDVLDPVIRERDEARRNTDRAMDAQEAAERRVAELTTALRYYAAAEVLYLGKCVRCKGSGYEPVSNPQMAVDYCNACYGRGFQIRPDPVSQAEEPSQ